jgi:hypothetical protein
MVGFWSLPHCSIDIPYCGSCLRMPDIKGRSSIRGHEKSDVAGGWRP